MLTCDMRGCGDGLVVGLVCRYVVLLQKDEALYEYEAVNQVLHNAIDVPVEIQGGALSFGNLGWGNGSCQGMLRGGWVQASG